jgi:hypothetical protein
LAHRKAGNPTLAQQKMAAFRALKSAEEQQQSELVQFLKIGK